MYKSIISNVVIYLVTKLNIITLTQLFQGAKRHLNSIFYNFHQMVHGWAEGHMHKHLKREVLVNLIEKRETYATKLQTHLDKQTLSYRDAVLEIHNRDSEEDNIPEALGDFILAAISLTTKIPIFLIYPKVEKTKDRNDRPVTINTAHIEYLFRKDASKAKTPSPNLVVMVYNGLDYYAPTAPKEIASMTRDCTQASTHLDDAMVMLKRIIKDLPGSTACESLTRCLKFMGAANSQLEGTSLATGTTCAALLPKEIPIPKPSTSEAVAKTVHKQAAAALRQAPPEKKKNESDEAFTTRKRDYAASVTKLAKRSTNLGTNQCPCAKTFDSLEALIQHQANAHPDKKVWKCSYCDSISNTKGHLWTHARKHLGKYYHYCDVKYTNSKNKVVVCEKGCDEVIGIEFHRETQHKVGHCSCRCDYCDKPQQSLRRKKIHHKTCSEGPNKDGAPTEWCDQENCGYSCRSAQQLRNHMATDHYEVLGLPAPRRWKCDKCGKEFKTYQGHKGHDCTTIKVRKPRKRKQLPVIG